ncbi:hypothetical protein J3R83DRAFT_10260 [Lanmaoa asiatica]|nr:hypothetical protein J3R83DRAFT_10260 [Lanmaoa asiatica]
MDSGSAARGKDVAVTGLQVHVAGPWITRDIEDAQECEFDRMLRSFILDCIGDESSTMEQADSLLQSCLDGVLPICNDSEVRQYLEAYSKATGEKDLYPHFSMARRWYNPTKGASSVRKPDVVLVSIDDIQDGDENDDFAKPPKKSLSWRQVRTAIEFKMRRKMSPLPAKYTKNKYSQPDENIKYLIPTLFDDKSAVGPQSDNAVDKGAGFSAATRKRKVAAIPSGGKLNLPWPTPAKYKAVTQTGLYGAEMFASHAGRHHAICLTIVSDHVYVWRYDRQSAIQVSALNFIEDFPRFLVLLFAMQRDLTKMIIEDQKEGQVDVVLDWSSEDRTGHYGLTGRATNVCPATSQRFSSSGNLVAKLFWGEISRASEPEILKKVYKIAEKEPDVHGHVPVMVFHYKFPSSSTATIRLCLGLPIEGSRELFLILFQTLMKITKLVRDPFLNCWWQTVKCHLALWKNGVYHRDVSASNLMYKDEGDNPVGVLNDFDLATMAEGPTGDQRTGTVPFMALKLLTMEGQVGEIKHVYAHDAESFIWVLTWVCARYDLGVLRRNTPMDAWLKVDAIGCAKEKQFYLFERGKDISPGLGHERNWAVAQGCLDALKQQVFYGISDKTCDGPFERLLAVPYETQRKRNEEEMNQSRKGVSE